MKKMHILSIMIIVLFVTCGTVSGLFAQEKTENQGKLTVPWEEFKKLLRLEKNEIVLTLDTFEKLLAQTGTKAKPPHSIKEGNVILSRVEFKKLIDKMKPPIDLESTPPFDYLITKAIYSGIMKANNTDFTGTFHVHVLKKGVYLKVPILSQNIALKNVQINGKDALIVSESGYHNIVLSKTGVFTISAIFSIKSSLEKGPQKIDLPIRQTPITLLTLEMPLKNIDVEVPQAQQMQTNLIGNKTMVSAIVSPGRSLSVRWRKKVAVTEKIPPKLYSEVNHLISIEDDALKIHSEIHYNILHSEVDGVRILVPEDVNVLSISGEGVGEWQEQIRDDNRLIHIPFTYGKKGAVIVYVSSEKTISDDGNVTSFAGMRVLDTVRETGFIGVELRTSAEVRVTESVGLEKVAIQKLPQELVNRSIKPLMHGFKYLKHPFSLVLDIQKHEKISVPVATIETGNMVTLFTEDGKVVHRLVYQIRNSAKQFLEIQLPEDADVWSVFVDNGPVESSINGQGKLLVPLIRSRSLNNRLDTFPVEVIYCLVQNRFAVLGSLTADLPTVDLLTSQIIWSVYLPNDYAYPYFKSTLEKEEIIRGLNVFSTKKRVFDGEVMDDISGFDEPESAEMEDDKLQRAYKGKDYRSTFRNLPLKEEQLKSQVENELQFSDRLQGLAQQGVAPTVPVGGGVSGILPIQIQIPTGGQVYRFAKTIVKSEDPLTVNVTYAQLWLVRLIRWFVFLILLIIVFLKRKTLKKLTLWIGSGLGSLRKWFIKVDPVIKKIFQARMTPFVLIGLFFIFYTFSKFLVLVTLFLLWINVIYHILRYRDEKTRSRSKTKK